jgi:hypothetical protein
LLLACAARQGAPPPVEARARDLSLTTERFELHANAYVGLHAWLWDTARRPAGASAAERAMDPFGPDVEAYRAAIANATEPVPRDFDIVAKLRRCSDDRCALRAMHGTPFEGAFAEALPRYVQIAWNEHADVARAAMERATPLLRLEGALVDGVAKDLGIPPPADRTRLDVVGHSESERVAGGVLGARGACFVGEGILECALFAMATDRIGVSRLAEALRPHMGAQELGILWGNVVAYAVAARVEEATRRASRLGAFLRKNEWRLARWLARAWPKWRTSGDAAAFAKGLVDEVGAPEIEDADSQ